MSSEPRGRALSLCFRASGLSLEARPLGTRAPTACRVALRVGGLCRTDLAAAEGALAVEEGRVLGHEASGVVVEGPPSGPAPGTRVAIVPWLPCEACSGCASGEGCASPRRLGVELDGLFRELVDLPPSVLLPVSERIDDRHAAFVEPLAAALAVRSALPPARARAAIVGRGRMAQLATKVLATLGVERVDLVDPGAPEPREPSHDWVLDVSSSSASLALATSLARRGATIVARGRLPEPVGLRLDRLVARCLTLRGLDYAPFELALAWLGEHRLDDLFGESWPLARAAEAFELARAEDDRKVFLSLGSR